MVDETPIKQEKPVAVTTATIRAGEFLSDSIDLTTGSVAMVVAPAEWTAANVSFLVSVDNQTWGDLFYEGHEALSAVVAGTAIVLPSDLTNAALYLKIRSGSRNNPIPQEAERVFSLGII